MIYVETDKWRKRVEITGSEDDLRYLALKFEEASKTGAVSLDFEGKGRFLIVRDGS